MRRYFRRLNRIRWFRRAAAHVHLRDETFEYIDYMTPIEREETFETEPPSVLSLFF
jgi:hypothetical protein